MAPIFAEPCTEVEKMACTWFREVPSCCSLTLLLGPAWVLLRYVLQTIFSDPVHSMNPALGGRKWRPRDCENATGKLTICIGSDYSF